jgi:hypothetical protein
MPFLLTTARYTAPTMQYISPLTDPEVRADLISDLSGLTIGSAFLIKSAEHAEELIRACDAKAKEIYARVMQSGQPAGVESLTFDTGSVIGFDSLKPACDLPEGAAITQVYRYFDSPREAIVAACIAAPHEIPKTKEITFVCGPDRRKTGNYRIFSLHPGPARQQFPNRYQPEAVRKVNREFWDRHVFLATPNQVIAAKRAIRDRYTALEPEARERAFHIIRQMESCLQRWYDSWGQVDNSGDIKSLLAEVQTMGDYGMGPDGIVYFYLMDPALPPPDLSSYDTVMPRLSNKRRPSVIRPDGTEEYFLNGKRHRDDGPALIAPLPDGGWMEEWYEDGLVSRHPEDGPARIIYNAAGEIEKEVAIYHGAEVQETTLGEAAAPVKALQLQIESVGQALKWFEEAPDFQLFRGQIDFACARMKVTPDKVIREMHAQGDQMNLRWDFDRTLEQDERVHAGYNKLTTGLTELGDTLITATQAMRYVRGDANIVAAIWGKIDRALDRLIERGNSIPGPQGQTVVDALVSARKESKKYYQSLADSSKAFSATGK